MCTGPASHYRLAHERFACGPALGADLGAKRDNVPGIGRLVASLAIVGPSLHQLAALLMLPR